MVRVNEIGNFNLADADRPLLEELEISTNKKHH